MYQYNGSEKLSFKKNTISSSPKIHINLQSKLANIKSSQNPTIGNDII